MERVVRKEIKKMDTRYQIGITIAGMFFIHSILFWYVGWFELSLCFFALTLVQGFNALIFLDIKQELKKKFTFGR